MTNNTVIAVATPGDILGGHQVIRLTGKNGIIAVAANQSFTRGGTYQAVITYIANQAVATALAQNCVVTNQAIDGVVGGGTINEIIACCGRHSNHSPA
ncbi:MAG: hypothetical protein O9273_04770 [Acetobacteraceae bacterium]|nr:hypothetical protein [Acetobacteraceae bacterium]